MSHDPPPRDDLLLHLQVLRCQAGDEAAFAALYATYAPRTLRYLRGLVRDDADDVQQETWLGVYRRVGQLADPGAFVTWLYGIARHRAIDWLRRRKRSDALAEGLALEAAHDEGTRDEEIDVRALPALVDALPPALREVLVLRYQDDLTYGEIALVVGCAVGTIRSRLHHAKRRLHELLETTRAEARPLTSPGDPSA